MTKLSSKDPIINLIFKAINEEKPQTVKQLVAIIHERYTIPEEKILNIIIEIEKENALQFTKDPLTPQYAKLNPFSKKIIWYWITIVIAIATTITVFTIPEGVYPIGYLRIGLGVIFVLFLPGFVLVRVLFLGKTKNATPSQTMDALDYTAFSLGINIAVVAAIGLILNYSPWGLSLTSITLSLLALTTILATASMIRELQLEAS